MSNEQSFDELNKQMGFPSVEPVTELVIPDGEISIPQYSRDPLTWTPFPLDTLPVLARRFVEEVSLDTGQNTGVLALFLLAFAGQTIGATFTALVNGDWRISPTLWALNIGRSGSGKSIVTDLLAELVSSRQERYETEYQWLTEHFEQHEHRKTTKKPNGQKEDETALAWDEYFRKHGKPICREAFLTDSTLEALQMTLKRCPWGVTVLKDEAASLFADLRRTKDTGSASNWYAGWGGARVVVNRINRGRLAIPRAHWSILGNGTPGKIAGLFGSDGFNADGLLSRFLLLTPPTPKPQRLRIHEATETLAQMRNVFEILADVNEQEEAYPEKCPDVEPVENPFSLERSESGAPCWFVLKGDTFQAFADWDFLCQTKGDSAATELEASLWSKVKAYSVRLALALYGLDAAEAVLRNRQAGDASPVIISREIPHSVYQRGEAVAHWATLETLESYRVLGFLKRDQREDFTRKVEAVIVNANAPIGKSEITKARGLNKLRAGDGNKLLDTILKDLLDTGRIQMVTCDRGATKYTKP